jgi:opacity protein-like surface antigen
MWPESRKIINSCVCGIAAVLLAGIGTQAYAQGYGYSQSYEYAPQRRVQWHFDAGYAITSGRTADNLDNGWGLGTGFTFHPKLGSPFSLRADLDFNQFGATNRLLRLGEQQSQTRIDDGTGWLVNLSIDGVFDIPLGPRARGYVLAGVGGAYRRIELTQTVRFAGVFCDDWYGFCGIGFFPGDILVQRQETTRFALNAGLGVEFPLYNGQSWFIEARYTRMQTNQPTEFIPIRIGMRF